MKSDLVQAALFSLVAAATAVLPTSAARAEAGSTNAVGPRIQFASTVYDFGKVMVGAQVRNDFVFTNTGDAVLEIKGVYPSCGCTTAGAWSHQVEPGMTGVIPLEFNSAHFAGPVAKSANVICNDTGQQQVMLQLKGTVWKPIQVQPSMAVLNVVSDSPSNAPATVSIVSSLEEDITLANPETSNNSFTAELKTIRPGREFQLIIRAVPPFGQGNQQGTITLKTSATNVPPISVIAIAIAQARWVMAPPQIVLPAGPLTNAIPYSVSIRHNGGDSMILSDPSVNADGVVVDLKTVVPDRQFALTLHFPDGFEVPGGGQMNLTVKTSDPKDPVIRVPIRQGAPGGQQAAGLRPPHPGPSPLAPPLSRPIGKP